MYRLRLMFSFMVLMKLFPRVSDCRRKVWKVWDKV